LIRVTSPEVKEYLAKAKYAAGGGSGGMQVRKAGET